MARLASALAMIALFSLASAPAFAQAKPDKTVTQKKARKKKPAPAPAPPPAEPEPEPTPPPPPPAPPPVVAEKPVAKDSPPPSSPSDDDEAPRPISIAPMLGYATSNLNLGVGVRGGYTFENRLYVGGTFVYHLGTSEESSTIAGKVETSASAFYPGAEIGYELPVGPVAIRPYGGIGMAFVNVTLKAEGQEDDKSNSSLALWPGCTVTYAIPKTPAFVGGDARLLIITKADDPSFGMFATGGVRF